MSAGLTTGALPDLGPEEPPGARRAGARAALLERTLAEVERVVVGQDRLVERLLVGLLARGHCLLEGAPGVAKTLAARTLADVIGGRFARLRLTPDLVPADVVGTRVRRPSGEGFETEPGPLFAHLVLADDIELAPAKVRSALLEAMDDGQATIAGTAHPLPSPFLVLATRNPLGPDGGGRPLSEAQRDRFLMKLVVDHPAPLDELTILRRRTGARPPRAAAVLDPGLVAELQAAADDVFVHDAVAEYIVRLVHATRDPAAYGLTAVARLLEYGAGPRATLGLAAAGRALAVLRGRDYLLPGDVADVATDVLAHRLVPTPAALAGGHDPRAVAGWVLEGVPRPEIVPSGTGPWPGPPS
ncbi:AAA family ATPase [Nocardiopsis sediminis]|uniref:AAA family ATPase n=1 Tax=Nocardiopsis sediminis TaxID=1778267 RepID=A0ABV8FG82_9ACTN